MGDTSDGYSGVQGIGEKTALKLIQTHGSVENLLNTLDTLTPKMQDKIQADLESLNMSLRLAEIIKDVPLKMDQLLANSHYIYDEAQTIKVLQDYDLRITEKYLGSLKLV